MRARVITEPLRGDTVSRPVRLFGSDLLERFTRTRLVTLVLFWASAAAVLFVLGLRQGKLTGMEVGGFAVSGVLAWSLVEYALHRLVFHLDRWVPAAERFC